MLFPDSPRVIYKTNPLAEVVAEVQFPPILRIDAGGPVEFQEAIRGDYPGYRLERPNLQVPPAVAQSVNIVVQGMTFQTGPPQHVFQSEDKKWQVVLIRDKLWLKTAEYKRWEDFSQRVRSVRQVFERIYHPASYSRIGLRYVDIIRRSLLNLTGVSWSELLDARIAGPLATQELAGQIDNLTGQFHCRLETDNYFLTVKTAIAVAEPDKEKEPCFVIDADFHTHKRTEIADVEGIQNAFNRSAGKFFRWAIRDRLHDALRPSPVD
jgi:uncharacterized protein (TIGR04255 family)